jgi:hypothetical protein
MKSKQFIGVLGILVAGVLVTESCTHEPIFMEEMEIDPIDSMLTDTMLPMDFCYPDTVYFSNQILPILKSNCALSGCHDAYSATEGIILEDYASVISTGDIKAFNLDDSKIYKVIRDDDPDDVMPPPPAVSLNSDQIDLIAKWILQGAKDLDCDENAGGCNLENVGFSGFVFPLIQSYCFGCHSGNFPNAGIRLENYNDISLYAKNGVLMGAIGWNNGFVNMPYNQDKLDACTIDKIQAWINDGAQDN